MNASIQKFDISAMLQEKLEELTEVRGMSHGAAKALIAEAVREWTGAGQPIDEAAPIARGTKIKAYVNLRTYHISEEPEREPSKDECQFDSVTAAAIYVANARRPLLERMIAGKLGE